MTFNLTPVWGSGTRSRLYNSTGFFFLCWAAHYLPFYLMGRQLFLHHYLPAHLASALVTGALLEFVFNVEPLDPAELQQSQDTANPNSSVTASTIVKRNKDGREQRRMLTARERMGGQSMFALWAAAGVVLAAVIGGWWFFLPLTYGKPGLNAEQVVARKWLGYDLHFAK